jgi:hypothetical protein
MCGLLRPGPCSAQEPPNYDILSQAAVFGMCQEPSTPEDIEALAAFADVLVVANHSAEYAALVRTLDRRKTLVDLVRIVDDPSKIRAAYHGIAW